MLYALVSHMKLETVVSAIIRNTLRTSVRSRSTVLSARTYANKTQPEKAEEGLGEKVKKAAQAFKSDGSIGSKFNADGEIGKKANDVGGPFAADGAVGKQFTEHGAIGGTGQAVAEKAEAKGKDMEK